ncbi:PadR family transcriptional regulator [bacterium]|nr:MAG: PadR family transcriptional regulator [bacterium]
MSQDIGMRGEADQNANLIRGNTELLVLAVLRDGAAYGYSIAKEIERRAQGALSLKQGSIYPLLYALEEEGLVSSSWSEAVKGQRPRRMYSITESGSADLQRRLEGFLVFSRAILRTAGLEPDGRPVEEAG